MARQLRRLMGALAAAAACSAALAAPTLWISDVDGTLGTVDLGDGTVTIVGQMPVIMSDIAFDAGGRLQEPGDGLAIGVGDVDEEDVGHAGRRGGWHCPAASLPESPPFPP